MVSQVLRKRNYHINYPQIGSFYYRDVTYPYSRNELKYKKVSKKAVQNYMKDEYCKSCIEYVAEAVKNYYIDGYSGDVYIKNGKNCCHSYRWR